LIRKRAAKIATAINWGKYFFKVNVLVVKTNPMSTCFRCRLPSNYYLLKTGRSYFKGVPHGALGDGFG